MRYLGEAMRHKSITFRCSHPQVERMSGILREHGHNRSSCLSEALVHFLRFADACEGESLDLFDIVERVDGMGGPRFSQQA